MTIFAEEIQNIRTMIRIYGMHTCPDCACIEEQVRDNDGYEIIDIGEHVRNLKAFLRLRDSSPVFDEARRNGSIGIPCFVLEDGRVTLHRHTPEAQANAKRSPGMEDAGSTAAEGASCSLDGSGC